ncbi:MAG: DUF177 domain-containing protein [Flavobacteriaceae bacterium]|nr:DUF177 domain-containing protein [Flavobacteriaceae bacterium]
MPQSQFVIHIPKLKEGKNHLSFEIGPSFFDGKEFSIIQEADIKAEVQFDKGEMAHKLHFSVAGKVKLSCDRCMEMIFIPLENKEVIVAKEGGSDDDDEVINVNRGNQSIDLEPLIYDIITTAIPLRISCEMDGAEKNCNEEALQRIENLSTKDIEPESRIGLWDKLREMC